MARFVAISVLLAAISAGCQKGQTAYQQDLDNICEAQERSGALDRPENERMMVVAQWLADNIQSDQARQFLGNLADVPPEQKAQALDEAAEAAGLKSCPLARTWEAEHGQEPL